MQCNSVEASRKPSDSKWQFLRAGLGLVQGRRRTNPEEQAEHNSWGRTLSLCGGQSLALARSWRVHHRHAHALLQRAMCSPLWLARLSRAFSRACWPHQSPAATGPLETGAPTVATVAPRAVPKCSSGSKWGSVSVGLIGWPAPLTSGRNCPSHEPALFADC